MVQHFGVRHDRLDGKLDGCKIHRRRSPLKKHRSRSTCYCCIFWCYLLLNGHLSGLGVPYECELDDSHWVEVTRTAESWLPSPRVCVSSNLNSPVSTALHRCNTQTVSLTCVVNGPPTNTHPQSELEQGTSRVKPCTALPIQFAQRSHPLEIGSTSWSFFHN